MLHLVHNTPSPTRHPYPQAVITAQCEAPMPVITGIANREEVRDITIFAHSMGSWLTMEALRQYSIRNGGLNDKITNVVLASPDLDVDVFWRQMETLGPDRPPFTILVTQDDRALWFSRLIAGASRLGGTDPTSPEVLERLQQAVLRPALPQSRCLAALATQPLPDR